jgi:hypothetical protein
MSEIYFDEERQRFFFDSSWTNVWKYDGSLEERQVTKSLPGTKCVDFIGIRGNALYLIEVKDFVDREDENLYRLVDSGTGKKPNLGLEIADKAKGTLVGCLGAVKLIQDKSNRYHNVIVHFLDRKLDVYIIGIVSVSKQFNLKEKPKIKAVQDKLNRYLTPWLKCQVQIWTQYEKTLVDLGIRIEPTGDAPA